MKIENQKIIALTKKDKMQFKIASFFSLILFFVFLFLCSFPITLIPFQNKISLSMVGTGLLITSIILNDKSNAKAGE